MRASAILLAFALAVNAAPRAGELAAKLAKWDRKTPPAAAPAEGATGQRRLAGTKNDMAAVFTAANPSWTTCLTESSGTTTDPCASTLITCVGDDVTEIDFHGGIFGSCSLTGAIPKELGAITTLTKLLLYSNDLRGTVPKELGDLTNLVDFDLDHNEGLWGNLPLAFATQAWGVDDFEVADGTNFNVAPCAEGETAGSTVAEEAGGVMCFLDAQRAGQTDPTAMCTGENTADAGGMWVSNDACACDGSDCACVNDDTTTDSWGYQCGQYSTTACSGYDDDDFTAATQCCHCKMYVADDDAAGKVGMAAIIAGTAILLLMA